MNKPLHVGIDITPAVAYSRGVSRYTANLVRSLVKLPNLNLALYGCGRGRYSELESFVRRAAKEKHPQSQVTSALSHLPLKVREFQWKYLKQPTIRSLAHKLQVFHSWDWVQPPDRNLPLVSTIHDLAILKFPESASPDVLAHHQASWNILKERQAEIIAVSQSTKKDIIEHLQIPAERIHVIYEALPVEARDVMDQMSEEKYEQVREKMRLPESYLLFVGTREPRKNLMRLIKAWLPMAKDVALLIAGEEGWDQSQELLAKAPAGQLRFLGKVSDTQLAVLYEEAEAFVFPSLDEGFGLPILEAFSHGTPVITSNVGGLPEVAGNAAMYVNPLEEEDIRDGIKKMLKETPDAQRQRLQRMILRIQLFSWQRAAESTLQVYQFAVDRAAERN